MLYDDAAVKEQYIVFKDSAAYFGSRLSKAGFRHVFVIERQALGWICYDASVRDLHCITLPASWDNDVIGVFVEQNPGATVVQIFAGAPPSAFILRFGILSCVSVAQYILGVYWPLTISPHQLYLRLIEGVDHIDVGRIWEGTR